MSKKLTVLLFWVLTVHLTYGQLNKQIDRSQKEAILQSPFKSAKGVINEISSQKKVRPEYLGIIDSLRKEFPNDTIMLVEDYDFICLGCPADYIRILFRSVLTSLSRDYETRTYKRETNLFFDKQCYSDISELKTEIRKNGYWMKNPKRYGTENCFDGGHTFYTVIYPNDKILSMYMRCWLNEELRKTYE